MNTKKFLIFDIIIFVLAGFISYRFFAQNIDFSNSKEATSIFAPIITLIGFSVYRVGLYFHYKNKA